MMKCQFCGTDWESASNNPKRCAHCGGSKPEFDYEKGEPFFYKEYIVWCIRSYGNYEFVFYKGTTHIGNVLWGIRRMVQYQDGTDIMSYVLKDLEYQVGISETPLVEKGFGNMIFFQLDGNRLSMANKAEIADEVGNMIERAFSSS